MCVGWNTATKTIQALEKDRSPYDVYVPSRETLGIEEGCLTGRALLESSAGRGCELSKSHRSKDIIQDFLKVS